jgi:dynein heavy chain 1
LLVQDVENYDPILNPVLNKELKRTGGRVLITLGDQVNVHRAQFANPDLS